MIVIAKTTDGFLIGATEKELKEIVKSVSGLTSKEVDIGQKIPAIDYASTITKVKTLKDDYHFKQVFSALEEFVKKADGLKKAVEDANGLEI